VAVWGGAPSPGQTHEQFRESARFFELDGTPVERSLVAEVLETGNSVRDVELILEHADGSLAGVFETPRVEVSKNVCRLIVSGQPNAPKGYWRWITSGHFAVRSPCPRDDGKGNDGARINDSRPIGRFVKPAAGPSLRR
jgi:hypothetical protein